MNRPSTAAVLALLAATSLLALALPRESSAGAQEPAERRAPLLVVDRTGATLLGPAHMHLLVYNDGHVAYVSRSGAPGDDHSFIRELDVKIVQDLQAKLVASEALRLGDQVMMVTDVPLTTMTVFEGQAGASSNTFSYWIGADEHEPVEAALALFIAQHLKAPPPDEDEQREER